ncbi:MAG: transposase [Delftia sp.]|nr:transposase [Delftia sp.]
MAIDEKQIGEQMHTILSNRETGKIALLAETLKAKELAMLIPSFNGKGFEVKSCTRDLSQSYDWFCRQAFCNSLHVADKFHIIKSMLDATQDVRVRYRQELLTDKRLKFEAHKTKEEERKQKCKRTNQTFKPKNFSCKEVTASNGESYLELLARSRFLLYKYEHDWTNNQSIRAKSLFEKYPQIEQSYRISCTFRDWYKKHNIGVDKKIMQERLQQWYQNVENTDITEMINFKSLVERHEAMIINYFEHGYTNAIAENINSKIQRFIASNQGTRDREFFYFRLAAKFSTPAPQNNI